MCRGTSETCGISSTGRTSSPRDFVIIKYDKRMSSVCNQNRLESVSLKEREEKVTKRPCRQIVRQARRVSYYKLRRVEEDG